MKTHGKVKAPVSGAGLFFDYLDWPDKQPSSGVYLGLKSLMTVDVKHKIDD